VPKNNFRIDESVSLDRCGERIQGSLCDMLKNGEPDPESRVLVLDCFVVTKKSANPRWRSPLQGIQERVDKYIVGCKEYVLVQDRNGVPATWPTSIFLQAFTPVHPDDLETYDTDEFLATNDECDRPSSISVADQLADALRTHCSRGADGVLPSAAEQALRMYDTIS
jgi:hypothetical protein